MIENELKPTVLFDEDTCTFNRICHFIHSTDFSIHGDTSGNGFQLFNTRNLETSLDEETFERRIHFDEASRLKLSMDTDKHKSEATHLEPNVDIKRYGRRHSDEASRLELNSGNEQCQRQTSNSCAYYDVHLGNSAQERRHQDNLGHYDIDLNSDTQESPSHYYGDLESVAAGRRHTESTSPCDFDLDSDTVERRPFNNSIYCIVHDSETAERKPPDNSSHYDINLENVVAARRHVDGSSPYDLGHDNDAFERSPLQNSTYYIEPEINVLEREQSDSHSYYEIDPDTGAVFEWRDSGRSSHSAADGQKFRDPSLRLTDTEKGCECSVCYETTVSRRKCCKFPVCYTCLETYYATKVSMAIVKVQCIGNGCNKYVDQTEIMSYLPEDLQDRYMQLLVDANCDLHRKTCPRCSHITEVDPKTLRERGNRKYGLRCVCSTCDLIWCFTCQAPWHLPLSCRDYQHGDRQFKAWTKQHWKGQANAQRCPKCNVYIQRNGGCDHMTCLHCSTDFCYQCGKKYRNIKFIGNHQSRYSILGCKYRYKPNSPVTRRLVRGSIFGGKLLAAPVVGGLALGAGAVVVGLGLVALPFYGGYKLHQLMKQKRREREQEAMKRHWRAILNAELEENPEIGDWSQFTQYFGRARSKIISTYPEFEFDDRNYYEDDSDEYSTRTYSSTSVDEELEDSVERQNNASSWQQTWYEISSEASTDDLEATDLSDTGAINSEILPADSEVLNSSRDGASAKPARIARTGARRNFRTHLIESVKLAMEKTAEMNQDGKQNLSSSLDVAEARGHDEVVETSDEVTHL